MNAVRQPPAGTGASSFVTILAWIFIFLSGFASLIALFQNLLVHLMFNGPEFDQAMQASHQLQEMPAFYRLLSSHFRLFVAGFLLLCVTMFVSSIGLLKRRNWARLVFVGLMGLGIVWNVLGFCMQISMFFSFPEIGVQTSVENAGHFKLIMAVMLVFASIMVIAFSLLFGWIIKRLCSASIRQEFTAGD